MTSAMTIPMLAELAGRAALILALSWMGARFAFRRSASTRYAVWAAGFIAALALPIATGVLPSWHLAVLPPQDTPAAALSRPLDISTRTAASSAEPASPTSPAATEATDEKEMATAVSRPAQAPTTVPSSPLPWALIGWAGIAAVLVARYVASLLAVRWITRQAQPITNRRWCDALQFPGGVPHP